MKTMYFRGSWQGMEFPEPGRWIILERFGCLMDEAGGSSAVVRSNEAGLPRKLELF